MRTLKQIQNLTSHCVKYKRFDEIPTLKSYPLIGHTYLFFPGGKYKAERLTEAFMDISKALGPIFSLKLGGSPLVITLNPDDTQILFQNEGKFPRRPTFEALLQYRKKTFGSIGVVPGEGPEWYRLRKGVISLLKSYKAYQPKQKEIAIAFVEYVESHCDKNFVLKDIYTHILKYTIEVVSPGYRFSCLSGEKEASDIIKASVDFMNGLYTTLTGPPLWKIFTTQGYLLLEQSHNTIYEILRKHLEQIQEDYNTNPEKLKVTNPFMFELFTGDFSSSDRIMLAIEVFLGGIDATATTIAFALLLLAQNPQIQDVANTDEFLRACVRETLRLAPTAGGNSRFLSRDCIMSGYFIPAGNLVLSLNSGLSLDERYFKNAANFFPQRFLKENRDFHKFATLPFGHGPRICPGKRVAESEILMVLSEILKKFRIETVENVNVGMVFRMNRVPDKPIHLKFIPK